MNKKLFFPAMLVAVLAFGMTVLGCPDPGETDTWSDVTSLNQMDGTWKGTYILYNNKPIKEVLEEEGAWEPEMQAMLGDMKVTAKATITTTINASAKTQSMSITSTSTYSGGNINLFWIMLKANAESLAGLEEGITVQTDDKTHSINMTMSEPAEDLSDEYIAGMLSSGVKINQNGKKIKVPKDTMAQGLPEMIFTKQ